MLKNPIYSFLKNLFYLSLITSTFGLFFIGCQSGSEETIDESVVEGDDLSSTQQLYNNDQSFDYDDQISDDQYSSDFDETDQYSDDMSDGAMVGDSSLEDFSASAPGNVYFVLNDTQVFSSAQQSSDSIFILSQGDSVRADIVGDYAQIGEGAYVLASELTKDIVLRVPMSNPWN